MAGFGIGNFGIGTFGNGGYLDAVSDSCIASDAEANNGDLLNICDDTVTAGDFSICYFKGAILNVVAETVSTTDAVANLGGWSTIPG